MTEPARLTLLTRAGCHLCESARSTLEDLRAELGFDLSEVDISGDPELEQRYRELLPVVEIDGIVASELILDEAAVRSKLDTVGAWPT